MDNFLMDVNVPVEVDGHFAFDMQCAVEIEVLSVGHNGSSDEAPEGPDWEVADVFLTVCDSDGKLARIPFPRRNFIPRFVVYKYMETKEADWLVVDQIHQLRLGC